MFVADTLRLASRNRGVFRGPLLNERYLSWSRRAPIWGAYHWSFGIFNLLTAALKLPDRDVLCRHPRFT